MADDKKNISLEVEKTDTPPTPKQSASEKAEPVVADPVPAEKATPVEKAEPTVPEAPEPPKPDKEGKQTATPDKSDPAPAPAGKVVDFAAAREEAGKDKAPKQKTPKQKTTEPKDKAAAKASKGRPAKDDKAAPDKVKPPTRDKMSQSKAAPENAAPNPQEAPAPAAPRDATRAEKEEIVYLNLSELRPFKNHPFGVRDDAEMQGLVESVRTSGVNQPALVRPTEDGGYEIIAGHRRQRASELAGFVNMPCIVRNMTDDEAILAMTDDNLRHREKILPTEKAQSLKMQVEAIKHQGARPGEDAQEAGKRFALMEAVVQYAKSRPVFEGYKAARYSKKYLAEHGPELADYRAAKAALNELLDGEKLQKMDALKEKRRKLAARKKALYIRLDFLEQVVLYEVKRLACFANEYENDFIKAMMGRSAKVAQNDRARKQRELDALLARDKELDMLFERLYEDNVSGKIDDARFAKMAKRYE